MPRARKTKEEKVLAVIGTTALVGAGGFLLYYLLSGAGSENDAPLIPDSVERHIDRIVDTLNEQFDRRWVNLGISTLEAALQSVLPPGVVALVGAIHQAERVGLLRGLTGPEKKQRAVQLVRTKGRG